MALEPRQRIDHRFWHNVYWKTDPAEQGGECRCQETWARAACRHGVELGVFKVKREIKKGTRRNVYLENFVDIQSNNIAFYL